jgi:hypothetical protein
MRAVVAKPVFVRSIAASATFTQTPTFQELAPASGYLSNALQLAYIFHSTRAFHFG